MEALECERETLHGSHWSDVFLLTHSQQDPGATLLTGFQSHDVLADDPTGVPLGSHWGPEQSLGWGLEETEDQ